MKKQTLLVLLVGVLALVLTGCVGLPDFLSPESDVFSFERLTGSGNVVEETYDVDDFAAVSIESAFVGEVRHGDSWSVVVRADDNILPEVRVQVEDGTLHVGLARRILIDETELSVAITMPEIEAISTDGASSVTLDGFPHLPSLEVNVAGASQLTGVAGADTLQIVADGASTVTLAGGSNRLTLQVQGASVVELSELQATQAGLTLDGASTVTLAGEGEEVTLQASGASIADLENLPVDRATVVLAGSSEAFVTAMESIDLTAEGASELTYGGGATLTSSNLSGASSATERD